jgi:hypothetical protein
MKRIIIITLACVALASCTAVNKTVRYNVDKCPTVWASNHR